MNGNDDMINDLFGMTDGSILRTHSIEACEGRACCIHAPSDHFLKDAPLSWRSDRRLMERICTHGIGHPDPDHLAFVANYSIAIAAVDGIHGCCEMACCAKEWNDVG